ncbi:MAG: hypothetical protein QOJ07_3760 [Thermoleophilaceae bacterium]|jgi:hypothetical protein|nr:hypothetical protein [Thermoleophilaceae bacterium]
MLALAGIASGAVAAPAGARTAVATARCDPGLQTASAGTRLGPLLFRAGWDGYASWPGKVRNPDTGTYYAKSGITARAGTVATLSIAPAYRGVADLIYGQGPDGDHVLSDAVRFSSCRHGTTFFSGGLVVGGPECVELRVRARGSRAVFRRMVSIDRGDSCPALAPL